MARKFYYDHDGEKLGPVSGQELLHLRAQGEIDGNTWVRPEDSQTWRPLAHTDLREESEKRKNRGPLLQMLSGLSPLTLLLMVLVIVILGGLFVAMLVYGWPLLLLLIAFIMFARIIQSK